MGTDIYLNWEGMTKEEKKKQYMGYSIDDGNVGYLRASIGMVKENEILRMIFPMKYWKPVVPEGLTEKEIEDFWENFKGYEFDFSKEGYYSLQEVGVIYVLSEIYDVPLPNHSEDNEATRMAKWGETLMGLFQKSGFDKVETTRKLSFRYACMWINALFSFYEMGMEKYEKGLKPKVYISW